MTLHETTVGPVIPVSDVEASRAFDEGRLGLHGEPAPGGGHLLLAAGETRIYLLEVPAGAGKADWPLASFRTDDVRGAVDRLTAAGVEFLHQSERLPFDTDERGIAWQEDIAVAWMVDPDDQVLTVFELR